jgi:orotate phosphoribosyltransferase
MTLVNLGQKSKEEKREYLRNEIEQNGVYRVAPNNQPLPGKAASTRYTWQFYLRRCMFDPNFVFTAAELLIDKLTEKNVQIGACEDAGVPLGLAMSTILNTPMISIKKSRKTYGLLNFTEGRVVDKPILLVDDLAGSQKTLRGAVSILQAFKLPLSNEYAAIVDKTTGTHKENYLHNKKLVSLFTCEDFAMSWKAYVEKFDKNPVFGSYY